MHIAGTFSTSNSAADFRRRMRPISGRFPAAHARYSCEQFQPAAGGRASAVLRSQFVSTLISLCPNSHAATVQRTSKANGSAECRNLPRPPSPRTRGAIHTNARLGSGWVKYGVYIQYTLYTSSHSHRTLGAALHILQCCIAGLDGL